MKALVMIGLVTMTSMAMATVGGGGGGGSPTSQTSVIVNTSVMNTVMEWAAHLSKTWHPMRVRLPARIRKIKLSVRQVFQQL